MRCSMLAALLISSLVLHAAGDPARVTAAPSTRSARWPALAVAAGAFALAGGGTALLVQGAQLRAQGTPFIAAGAAMAGVGALVTVLGLMCWFWPVPASVTLLPSTDGFALALAAAF
jgi:hypothetical protein